MPQDRNYQPRDPRDGRPVPPRREEPGYRREDYRWAEPRRVEPRQDEPRRAGPRREEPRYEERRRPEARREESRESHREESRESRREDAREPRRRKKRSSPLRTAGLVLLYVVCVIGASILLACAGWVAASDVLALNKEELELTFTISNGESFDDVADRLKKEGLIEYKWLFKLFASITGGEDKVTMGTYTLNTDMDYRALLSGMSANSATRSVVKITIPEGYTMDQIFALLEEKGSGSVASLREAAATHDYAFSFLQDIPLGDYHRLEGYLMPSTYEFYTPHDPVYAINKLLVYFDAQVTNDIRAKAEESGRSLREVLTIASLIERETDGSDRAKISSVIHNRLNNPDAGTQGYLNIDASLVYINGGKEPTEADKSIDSPYNTYLYKGLPPGPIANPGMESILAALNPEDTKFFYYALGDDGVHHYFKTYDELQKFTSSQELYQ